MSRSTARKSYREGFSISWILGQDITEAAPRFSLRMWKMEKKKSSWCNAVWPKLCHSGIYLCFTFRSHSYLPFLRLGLVLNFKRRYSFFPQHPSPADLLLLFFSRPPFPETMPHRMNLQGLYPFPLNAVPNTEPRTPALTPLLGSVNILWVTAPTLRINKHPRTSESHL